MPLICILNIHRTLKKGDRERAIADYLRVLSLVKSPVLSQAVGPSMEGLTRLGVDMFGSRLPADDAENIAHLTERIERSPQGGFAYLGRCEANVRMRKYDAAIADCDQALAQIPGTAIYPIAQAHNNRGKAYYHKDSLARALADFDRAIRLAPQHAEHYFNRTQIHIRRGDVDLAIAYFGRAIRRHPKVAAFYLNRGRVYERKGEREKAIADHRMVVTLHTKRQQTDPLGAAGLEELTLSKEAIERLGGRAR